VRRALARRVLVNIALSDAPRRYRTTTFAAVADSKAVGRNASDRVRYVTVPQRCATARGVDTVCGPAADGKCSSSNQCRTRAVAVPPVRPVTRSKFYGRVRERLDDVCDDLLDRSSDKNGWKNVLFTTLLLRTIARVNDIAVARQCTIFATVVRSAMKIEKHHNTRLRSNHVVRTIYYT